MNKKIYLLIFGLALLAGCQAAPGAALDPMAKAYAEATQISQSGAATAIVAEAHATADARLQQISGQSPTLRAPEGETPGTPTDQAGATPFPTSRDADRSLATATPRAGGDESAAGLPSNLTPTLDGSLTPVQCLGVSFGADGALIVVQFKASPTVAKNWFQNSFSVTDEATGMVYDQVSVAPIIGPLITRPREEGKAGYAMLTNMDNKQQGSLKGGELVTVTLGDYRFEHVRVQKLS